MRAQRNSRGQSITEYCMVIAFVSCLIALAFSIANGTLFAAVSNSYSSCNSTLGALNAQANQPM